MQEHGEHTSPSKEVDVELICEVKWIGIFSRQILQLKPFVVYPWSTVTL
jgi:hypothetical protein